MKKKGFTLIELLAVIVILAIIALIATPLVLKYIEYSKEKSAKLSAQTYAEAVEKEYVSKLTNNKKIPNGTYNIEQLDNYGVKVKGDKPEGDSDTVTLRNGNVIEYVLTIKGYTVTYKDGNTTVGSGNGSNNGELLDYTVTFMLEEDIYEVTNVKKGNAVNAPATRPAGVGYWGDVDGNQIIFPFTPTSDTVIYGVEQANALYNKFDVDQMQYPYIFISVNTYQSKNEASVSFMSEQIVIRDNLTQFDISSVQRYVVNGVTVQNPTEIENVVNCFVNSSVTKESVSINSDVYMKSYMNYFTNYETNLKPKLGNWFTF